MMDRQASVHVVAVLAVVCILESVDCFYIHNVSWYIVACTDHHLAEEVFCVCWSQPRCPIEMDGSIHFRLGMDPSGSMEPCIKFGAYSLVKGAELPRFLGAT